MKILFVADVSIARVIGGAERVLFEQTTRFAQRDHEVHIITRKLLDHNSDQDTIRNVHEWRYPIEQKNTFSFFFTSRNNGKQLFETLHQKFKFDCINFHQPISAFGVLQSQLSQEVNKIYTCHSLSFEEFNSRNSKKNAVNPVMRILNERVRKKVESKVLKSSDQLTVLSRFTKDKLKKIYNIPDAKISIIPGGVDLERFRPVKNKKTIREKLNMPKSKLLLLTVRNLVPRMGLDNLIYAFKKISGIAPDIHLIIGGEGQLEHKLNALVKDLSIENSVTFTGYINDKELPEYYQMADIFVLPTKELEGFGLVTLEAMASGIPVLGTPVGGIKEIIERFDHGFLFKDTSPEAMVDLIIESYRKIKQNPSWYENVSKRCRQFVEENYSWERNVDSLEKLFFNFKEIPYT